MMDGQQTIDASDVGNVADVLGAAESTAVDKLEEPAAVSESEQRLIDENERLAAENEKLVGLIATANVELTDELALAKGELETANARVADLNTQLEAARAEFAAGSAPIGDGIEHTDDELCNRWVAAGGMAEDYELAKRFARSL